MKRFAIILAGGRGTRLGDDLPPKAMLKVRGKTLIQHQLDRLKKLGFDHVGIALGHRAEEVKWKCPDGMFIFKSVEDEPLGTAGAVKKLHESFFSSRDFSCAYVLNVDDLVNGFNPIWFNSNKLAVIWSKPIPFSVWVDGVMFAQNEAVQHVGHTVLSKKFLNSLPQKGSLEVLLAESSKNGNVGVARFEGVWVTVNNCEQLLDARKRWKL